MYVINLIYTASLERIDDALDAHRAFLAEQFEAGVFVAAGPKVPRDGGIILAVGKSRKEIEALIQEDPFHQHGLADFRVIEFRASQRAGDMPKRIES